MHRDVVITGLAPLCSIADSAESLAAALASDTRSLTPIQSFDASGFRTQLAGQVLDHKIRDHVPKHYRKATKVMARDTELAVIAAKAAFEDAGLMTRGSEDDASGHTIDPSRTGCNIGAGLIAADTEEMARAVSSAQDESGAFSPKAWGTLESGAAGMNNLPPLWLLKYLPNMLACHVTIIHGLEGPSNTIMGAESGALLSIGESARIIERGDADLCVAGGAESRLNPLGLLRCELTDRYASADPSDNPSELCKPHDPESKGSLPGEGAGMLILEERSSAESRDARIYANLLGFAATQSLSPALPIFPDQTPDADTDDGLHSAITRALKDADLRPDQIDAVFPLAQGNPQIDTREQGAIHAALGPHAKQIPWFGLCDRVGNTLAAHAGLMTAAAALSVQSGNAPSTPLPSGAAQPNGPIKTALVCSTSLGGQCAALVLSA